MGSKPQGDTPSQQMGREAEIQRLAEDVNPTAGGDVVLDIPLTHLANYYTC